MEKKWLKEDIANIIARATLGDVPTSIAVPQKGRPQHVPSVLYLVACPSQQSVSNSSFVIDRFDCAGPDACWAGKVAGNADSFSSRKVLLRIRRVEMGISVSTGTGELVWVKCR